MPTKHNNRSGPMLRAADLVGISAMGCIMVLIGGGAAQLVDDKGMITTGHVVEGIGGVIMLFGLLTLAVYVGISASRKP